MDSLTSTRVSAPNLYTRSVPAHRNEFLAAKPGGEFLPGKLVTTSRGGIRNAVFFVLESVAAE